MEPSLETLLRAPFDATSPTDELSPLAQRAANEAWAQRTHSFGRMADAAGETTAMDVDPGSSSRSPHDSTTQPTIGFGIQGTPGAYRR